MDEFLRFAQDHWWLAFPAFGALAAAGNGIQRAWERSAKRRHQRRLETIRVKGEIKAAQLAARGGGRAVEAPAKDEPARNDLLVRLLAEHDEINARWLDYELDVAKVIAFPTMSDGRQPLTAAFLRAKRTADALRPASAESKVTEQQISEYLDAVGEYAVAFETAEKEARRLRDSTFTDDERKRLDRAQQLLKTAVDESATQAERNVAYKRVREELEGLIVLSDAAVEVLEQKVAGELEKRADDPSSPTR